MQSGVGEDFGEGLLLEWALGDEGCSVEDRVGRFRGRVAAVGGLDHGGR